MNIGKKHFTNEQAGRPMNGVAPSSPGALFALIGLSLFPAAVRARQITIEPCSPLPEVADQIQRSGAANRDDFLAAARDPEILAAAGIPADSAEGYLLPGTYEIDENTSSRRIILSISAHLRHILSPLALAKAAQRQLSERQILAMASLVELAADGSTDLRHIAGVLSNRLRHQWPLLPGWQNRFEGSSYTGRQSCLEFWRHRSRFRFDSEQTLLPATPLFSPSAAALRATLEPARTNRLVLFSLGAGSDRYEILPGHKKAFATIQPDPLPDSLTRNTHYWVSDEKRHTFFRSSIRNVGGVFLGVGTDQNFALAGWSRPELLLIIDFDQQIINLHKVYRVAFHQAETPERFFDFFHKDRRQQSRRDIRHFYRLRPRDKYGALHAFYRARRAVVYSLQRRRDRYHALGVPSFLDNHEQYAHVRALFQANRVYAIRGDLTGRATIRQLARLLHDRDWPIQVAYLSNCEQYFPYRLQYRKNMLALPSGSHSLLLRTRPTGYDYTYVVQRYDNFRKWLRNEYIRSVRYMIPRSVLHPRCPLYWIDELPSRPFYRWSRPVACKSLPDM